MNYCPECGSALRDDVKYCTACGSNLAMINPPEGANHLNACAVKKRKQNILWLFIVVGLCFFGSWVKDVVEEEAASASKVREMITEKIIEENVSEAVTEILARNFTNAAECERVTITERLGNEQYLGMAHLDNGNVLSVRFRLKGEDLHVEILP